MRKLFSFVAVSADGYYEGPNGEFDWPTTDAEFLDFSLEQLDEIGLLIFGRVTYEMMAAYWPTPEAINDTPEIAAAMNGLPKMVVSRTLSRPDWENTRLIRDGLADEIMALKREPGNDIAIFGSSHLTTDLIALGLVDEVRLMVNPIVLGAGNSLFRTAEGRIPLQLRATRVFRSGNVLLTYRPVVGE